jgi:hypothetical protein
MEDTMTVALVLVILANSALMWRLFGKLDTRISTLDTKVDALETRIATMDAKLDARLGRIEAVLMHVPTIVVPGS